MRLSPSVTSPISYTVVIPFREFATVFDDFLSMIKTIPTPMLKALYISSVSILPNSLMVSKTGRPGQELLSILTEHPKGRIRGIFSVKPPPVMWAIPFIFSPFSRTEKTWFV